MTWNEFKKEVDEKLKAGSISPDEEISYIDVYLVNSVNVRMDEDGLGLIITQ